MDESKNLIVSTQNSFIAPITDIQSALARYNAFGEFVSTILKKDIDYGAVPGTDKPTLKKPGAEKLGTFFGLSPKYQIVEVVNDWTGKDHNGEPFFFYHYKCQLYRPGEIFVGESFGSCNSWEKKYRYRWINELEIPSNIDKSGFEFKDGAICEFAFAIDKSETTGKYGKPIDYWQQFKIAIENGTARHFMKKTKKGDEMDAWEIGGKLYAVPNKDVADQVNTIDKMAQKRAFVAAILIATNASEYFTQDMEDFYDSESIEVIDGTVIEKKSNESAAKNVRKVKYFTPKQIQAIIGAFPDEKIEANHVSNMLSLSNKLTAETPIDLTVRWALKYCVESKRSGDKHLAADMADSEILGN